MKSEGKVQVVVKSRRVPVGTFLRTEPVYSMSGVLVGYTPRTGVLYGTAYDHQRQKTIEEARRLASSLGVGLEVVDGSRWGFVSRLLSKFRQSNSRHPAVLVSISPAMSPWDQSSTLNHGC